MKKHARLWMAFVGFMGAGVVGCASGSNGPDALSALGADNGDADVEQANAERNATGTLPFGEGMSRPTQYEGPTPSLPPDAIAAHVTGTWIARCLIAKDGRVKACRVKQGLPYGANEHIIKILYAQKYTPVIYKDEPQNVWYTFKITFR